MTIWKVTEYGFYWKDLDDCDGREHEVRYVVSETYFEDHDKASDYAVELLDGENEVEVTEIEVE